MTPIPSSPGSPDWKVGGSDGWSVERLVPRKGAAGPVLVTTERELDVTRPDFAGVSTRPSPASARSVDPPTPEPSTAGLLAGDTDPLIGFLVAGRYVIRRSLGHGGMGHVYEVEHREIGKLLALKVLAGSLASDPDTLRRFEREARLASRLSHPNTVQVFDYGTTDGLAWLLMELVQGEDLAHVLAREGPMPWRRIVAIIAQACASLGEAHACGIVHRDVKPGNLMVMRGVDGEDFVKVLDFGLAKLREGHTEKPEVTLRGMVVGTPHYMSPEQFRGEAVSGSGDIYGLGAVLYRALTGHAPFSGQSMRDLFERHAHQAPVPPHERAPTRDIPPELSAVVLRALAKDPADRHATTEELRHALLSLLDAHPASHPARLSLATPSLPPPAHDPKHATRDEVETFTRKLRRQRVMGWALVVATFGALTYGGLLGVRASAAVPAFEGVEHEPNDTPAHANVVPLGRAVVGTIGRRIDPQTPDRDFYRVEIPETAVVGLHLTGLPNMASCVVVYPVGEREPLSRWCAGEARTELAVPAYRLERGGYYFVVTQDLAPRGAMVPSEVVENVSDTYELRVTPAEADRGPR